MADDRERALEAARRIVAAVNWTARGLHGDAQLVARALLAEAPAVPSLDWPKILQRYGAIHERISTYEDDDESPALMKLCELRDRLLSAVRLEAPHQILAALEATNVIPGRAPSPSSAVRDACQYAQDVGAPEYRCVGECQYAVRDAPLRKSHYCLECGRTLQPPDAPKEE